MKKVLVSFLFLVTLIPLSACAAGVGFVPSTGIWFSRSSFLPHDTIRVYSVIINNDYFKLDAVVGFYDNGELIDTATVTGLVKEMAQQVKVFWSPTEGQHTLTARFIKAVAIDDKGGRKELNLNDIVSSAGSPLTVAEGQVAPTPARVASATVGAQSSSTIATSATTSIGGVIGATIVEVAKQGTRLAVQAPVSSGVVAASAEPAVLGEKVAALAPRGEDTGSDIFAKNKEVLEKAQAAVTTITSTAGKIGEVYNQTKSVVEKGKGYYEQGQSYWQRVKPYAEKVKPWWLKISNNNEPKRIAIIVVSVLAVWWLLKWWWRRKRRLAYERGW